MSTRLNKRTVVFTRPFVLDEVERQLPAGAYDVETEEETLDGVSFLAWRRVATHIFLRGKSSNSVVMQLIDPQGLAAAIERDLAPPLPASAAADRGR